MTRVSVGDSDESFACGADLSKLGMAAGKKLVERFGVGREVDATVGDQFQVGEQRHQAPILAVCDLERSIEQHLQPGWDNADRSDVLADAVGCETFDLLAPVRDCGEVGWRVVAVVACP